MLPLLLTEDPGAAPVPRSTPFTAQHQKDCRFDGELEGDARDPEKRRPLVATEERVVDHHVQAHAATLFPGQEPKPEYLLPLMGAQLSRSPHYRLLRAMTEELVYRTEYTLVIPYVTMLNIAIYHSYPPRYFLYIPEFIMECRTHPHSRLSMHDIHV